MTEQECNPIAGLYPIATLIILLPLKCEIKKYNGRLM